MQTPKLFLLFFHSLPSLEPTITQPSHSTQPTGLLLTLMSAPPLPLSQRSKSPLHLDSRILTFCPACCAQSQYYLLLLSNSSAPRPPSASGGPCSMYRVGPLQIQTSILICSFPLLRNSHFHFCEYPGITSSSTPSDLAPQDLFHLGHTHSQQMT